MLLKKIFLKKHFFKKRYSISLEREETSQGTRRAIQQIHDFTEEQIWHMNKCSAFQKNPNLILQKRAISPSRLTGTPWGILENILLRHALVDNIIGLLGFDLTFSFFLFFGFLLFWFVRMNTCLKNRILVTEESVYFRPFFLTWYQLESLTALGILGA